MTNIVKLSTSMAALLLGLSVANAQVEEPRQGQGGQGGAQMEQRQEQGGGQQGGAMEKREGSGERAERKDDGDKGEKRQRTGQGDDQGETRKDRNAQGETKERKGESTERSAQGKDGDRTEQRSSRSDDGDGKKRVKNVQITKEKKTVIRERVITKAPKRYTRNEINFNLSVGTAIPSTYVIYDLPPTFIEIVPEYQGYDYIVVGDVLLIIDPDTREIVDVVQV